MRQLLRVLLLSSASAIILTNCALMTDLSVNPKPAYDPLPAMCEVFTPIHWSKQDTDQTIKEIKTHNSVWLQICGPIKRPSQNSMPP